MEEKFTKRPIGRPKGSCGPSGKKTTFNEQVATAFRQRLYELGWSQSEFCRRNPSTNMNTFGRMMRAEGNTSMDNLVHYAELLDFEILIRRKGFKQL